MLIRGLYTGASGMLAETIRTDVISNNIANVNTTGFKKDRVIFRAYPEMNIHRVDDPVTEGIDRKVDPRPFIGMLGTGVMVDEVNTDFSQGSINTTSNPLDIALNGEGFFAIQTPEGVKYTRDGSFSLNGNRDIVTKDGHYVLGENGQINLLNDGEITITGIGEIFVDGQYEDRLRVVVFGEQDLLLKQGDNLFTSTAQPTPVNIEDTEVVQGALEGANLNTVKEMVDLITAFRAYEASQRVIRTHDETLDKAVNDIARL